MSLLRPEPHTGLPVVRDQHYTIAPLLQNKSNLYCLHQRPPRRRVSITFPRCLLDTAAAFVATRHALSASRPGESTVRSNSKRRRARRTLGLQHRAAADRPSPPATCRLTTRVGTCESERFMVDLEVRPRGFHSRKS